MNNFVVEEDVDTYYDSVVLYSEFSYNDLITIISKLIFEMENKNFSFIKKNYNISGPLTKYYSGDNVSSEEFDLFFLTSGVSLKDNYNYSFVLFNEVQSLVESGDIIMLDLDRNVSITDQRLSVYSRTGSGVVSNFNFSSYSYVLDFFNKIIEYKMICKVDELNLFEILIFIDQFVLENKKNKSL